MWQNFKAWLRVTCCTCITCNAAMWRIARPNDVNKGGTQNIAHVGRSLCPFIPVQRDTQKRHLVLLMRTLWPHQYSYEVTSFPRIYKDFELWGTVRSCHHGHKCSPSHRLHLIDLHKNTWLAAPGPSRQVKLVLPVINKSKRQMIPQGFSSLPLQCHNY